MTPDNCAFHFTVMSLNLRFGRAEDGPDNWKSRQGRYKSFFKKYTPDFIGMQEANDFQVDFFKQLLEGYGVIGRRAPAPDHWQDNVIFFNKEWKCNYAKRFFVSSTPSKESSLPGSKWPRQFVVGEFVNGNRSLVLVNTHFDFESSVQKKSARIVLRELSENQHPDHPVVITGDFNADPDSPAYREFVIENGFKEVYEGEYTSTYHGFTGTPRGDHIDWILFRGPIEAVEKDLITESFNGGYPSDHFPVLARFKI